MHRRSSATSSSPFLDGVGSAPNADYAGTIPQQTFMVYQLMFAIITPALISGAFAERMKFSAMLLFTVSVVVHRLLSRWPTWSGAKADSSMPSLGGKFPTLRFRRRHGRPHHIGVSALVCALYLGKRLGYPERRHEAAQPGDQLHRRLPALGGMVRIQRGQRAGGSGLATSAFVATHFASAAAAIGLGWRRMDLATASPACSAEFPAAVAGLVAITPASGFVKPLPALLIGLIAGVFCYFMVAKVKAKFGYDDSLDAFGVHGAGGTLGAILTGVFAVQCRQSDLQRCAAGKSTRLRPAGRQCPPGAESVDRRRHRLGPRDRRHARDPQDRRRDHRLTSFGGGRSCKDWISPQHGEEGYYWETPA